MSEEIPDLQNPFVEVPHDEEGRALNYFQQIFLILAEAGIPVSNIEMSGGRCLVVCYPNGFDGGAIPLLSIGAGGVKVNDRTFMFMGKNGISLLPPYKFFDEVESL